MLAFVSQEIKYKNQEVVLQLYRSSVVLHLVDSVQFWLAHNRKHVEALERVQKRFTRILQIKSCLA